MGGAFYTVPDPKLYAAVLDYILSQVHPRYTLSFTPLMLDGKHRSLKVELTKDAQKRYRGLELRFPQGYVPLSPAEPKK
jgi:hypothetical protein